MKISSKGVNGFDWHHLQAQSQLVNVACILYVENILEPVFFLGWSSVLELTQYLYRKDLGYIEIPTWCTKYPGQLSHGTRLIRTSTSGSSVTTILLGQMMSQVSSYFMCRHDPGQGCRDISVSSSHHMLDLFLALCDYPVNKHSIPLPMLLLSQGWCIGVR